METQEATQEVLEDQEVWKPVVGYEDLYEVSDNGNVRSLDRVTVGADGIRQRFKGRTLKPQATKGGYRLVNLYRNGEMTGLLVHRLAWVAFNGPIPEGMQIDHLNNLPGDNRLENLQVLTPKENIARQKLFGNSQADRVANGIDHQTRKIHCPRGHEHFSDNNVPSTAKRGARECLVCKRARGYLHRNPDLPESMEWAVYDYHLERFLLEARESVSGRVAVER